MIDSLGTEAEAIAEIRNFDQHNDRDSRRGHKSRDSALTFTLGGSNDAIRAAGGAIPTQR